MGLNRETRPAWPLSPQADAVSARMGRGRGKAHVAFAFPRPGGGAAAGRFGGHGLGGPIAACSAAGTDGVACARTGAQRGGVRARGAVVYC